MTQQKICIEKHGNTGGIYFYSGGGIVLCGEENVWEMGRRTQTKKKKTGKDIMFDSLDSDEK